MIGKIPHQFGVTILSRGLVYQRRGRYTVIEQQNNRPHKFNSQIQIIIMNISALHTACKNRLVRTVEKILNEDATLVHAVTESLQTPLHIISSRKDIRSHKIARMLLQAEANVNAIDASGNTPLHCACRVGNALVISVLIAGGAHVNLVNHNGETSLNLAGSFGSKHPECIRLLLQVGADVNSQDNCGNTPLMSTWSPDQLTVEKATNKAAVTMLLQAGASVMLRNFRGETVLDKYVRCHSAWHVVQFIQAGANLSAPDSSGQSLLSKARQNVYGSGISALILRLHFMIHLVTCWARCAATRSGSLRYLPTELIRKLDDMLFD